MITKLTILLVLSKNNRIDLILDIDWILRVMILVLVEIKYSCLLNIILYLFNRSTNIFKRKNKNIYIITKLTILTYGYV